MQYLLIKRHHGADNNHRDRDRFIFHFPHIHTVHRLYLQYIHMLYFMMETMKDQKLAEAVFLLARILSYISIV